MKPGLAAWLEERTRWRARWAAWRRGPAGEQAPVAGAEGARRAAPAERAAGAAVLATAAGTCFAVLALTGAVLMTSYAPAPQSAWASVHYAQYVQPGGWIVRGLHYWAAQALLLLAGFHVVHAAANGGYRSPRELTWWLTLLALGVATLAAITGGLLPWDEKGWWARVVEGNIVGRAPAIGPWVQRMLQGGTELGALGLARAHAAHVLVLPLLLLSVLWARRAAERRAAGWDAAAAARGAIVATGTIAALFVLTSLTRGAPLDAPADPMSDYPARPEWFLLPLFELRKFFHGAAEFWGTALLPGAAGATLVALPFLDRPSRSRPLAVGLAMAIFVGAIGLGVLAWQVDRHDAQYAKHRAKADARAAEAVTIARQGVPPQGALEMMRQDPELRGSDLFAQYCAGCHVLAGLGDPARATAPRLDGWGTPEWIVALVHDPDGPGYFGASPYKRRMPPVDSRPDDLPAGQPWFVAEEEDRRAVADFLAAEGDEPGDPPRALDERTRRLGETVVRERCTTCHLYQGLGDREGTGLAPELSRHGSLAWTRAQIANPATAETYREGALDPALRRHMPPFAEKLTAAEIDVLARWTRAHARRIPLR